MNKILLIDDDEDDQYFFKEALEIINPLLQCDTAKNGKIALDKLQADTALPDIIFLDLNMPLMSGFDFLVHIKKATLLSKIPVGIFTTSNIVREQELAKELGASFFMTKPTDFKVLCEKLQQVLLADFTTDEYMSIT